MEADVERALNVRLLSGDEHARSALAAGEFKVLGWATVVALTLLHLENLENRTED